MKEWSDDLWKILPEVIRAVWEANGKTVNKVLRVPATTMFVSANLTVAEVEKKITGPVRSKLCLLYTGSKAIQNERLSEKCTALLDASLELNNFLPSVVGLGKFIIKGSALTTKHSVYLSVVHMYFVPISSS